MDMTFSPQHLAFREEVRAWIASAMPKHLRDKAAVDAHFEHHEVMEWHRVLFERGWVAPHWPVEVGGAKLDATERYILEDELALAGAPTLSPFGLRMVGPLLIQFGTDAQKKRFLPKILSGEEVWCQGYSEPNAGSDLASLATRAEDDGKDHFIVNGQKTWTTYGQYAQWIFCLVRTESTGKKQDGITFLLCDLKTPGIVVQPMLTIGGTPAFAETFFENARVPKENVVGPLGGGWTVAKALLGHERTMIGGTGVSTRALRRTKRIAASTLSAGRPILEDPAFRAKIAKLEIRLRALEVANLRVLAGAQLGHAPGAESSILKIRGSEIQQQCFELALEIMGQHGLAWGDNGEIVPPLEASVASLYCYNRATTIYGGSNEIQRNVIAKLILGLPAK